MLDDREAMKHMAHNNTLEHVKSITGCRSPLIEVDYSEDKDYSFVGVIAPYNGSSISFSVRLDGVDMFQSVDVFIEAGNVVTPAVTKALKEQMAKIDKEIECQE